MLAKKSLGQNFLRVEKYLNEITKAGDLISTDTVLEIGPGQGDLTKKILSSGALVVCIEKDRELIPILEDMFSSEIKSGKCLIIEGDALDFDSKNYFKNESYKLIANIPYYITGALIRKYLSEEHKPSCVVLVIQKEVAERIVEKDGKSSILSLAVQFFGEPKYVMTIPRGAFSPSPNVDSAILKIEDIKNISKDTETRFFQLIHEAFKYKRKMLLGNLSPMYGKENIEKVFDSLSLSHKIRAEDIHIDTWLQINDLIGKT